ncbi:hypothetical protein B0O80DRAFT_430214 [Mortierella sp. GBAus27b]|nr:hypothetical protein B0O80DRAFT_430214 [Mortierella sp. GBAus27b]
MLSNLFSTRSSLAAQKAYELANVYRENAHTTQDRELAVVLCDNAAISLSRMKKSEKKVLLHPPLREHESRKKLRENIVDLYLDIAKLLESLNEEAMAAIQFKNAEKWGGPVYDPNHTHSAKDPASATALANDEGGPVSLASLAPRKKNRDVATIPPEIFQENQRPPAASYKFPDADERVTSTPQLGYLLTLLQFAGLPEEFSDKIAKEWVERTAKDNDEKERLKTMAVELVRMFTRDELKDNKAVSEVLYLAPGLEKSEFRFLLNLFHEGIRQSGLLDYHQLEGLAQLMRYAGTDYLEADDLVKILKHLSTRLIDTHQQSDNHVYRLTLALSNVLDAMADAKVKGLDRKTLHEPLRAYLDGQRQSSDPYLVYQSAYAYQALLFVPDNESAWQATMRRTGKVIQGVAGLVSAVKGLDLNEFVGSLQSIGQGLEGVVQVVEIVKDAYEGVTSLVESGQGFMESLKEGLSFDRRRDWYPGLRALDALLRDGQLATFKEAVCAAPCRRDPAFQWGVCQRLGELAANTTWPIDIRRNAMAFLVQIYKDDVKWGQSVQIKQWIIDILMQLSIISGPGNLMQGNTIALFRNMSS